MVHSTRNHMVRFLDSLLATCGFILLFHLTLIGGTTSFSYSIEPHQQIVDSQWRYLDELPSIHSGISFSVSEKMKHSSSSSSSESKSEFVNFSILLQHANPTRLSTLFETITNPSHPNYGQYLTRNEAINLMQHDSNVRQEWEDWVQREILQNNVHGRVTWDSTQTILRVEVARSHLEKLLGHRLGVYQHIEYSDIQTYRTHLSREHLAEKLGVPKSLRSSSFSHMAGLTHFPIHLEMLTNSRTRQLKKKHKKNEDSKDEDLKHSITTEGTKRLEEMMNEKGWSFERKSFYDVPQSLAVDLTPLPTHESSKVTTTSSSGITSLTVDPNESLLNSMYLTTDDGSFVTIMLIACSTNSASSWTYAQFIENQARCLFGNQLYAYTSTSITITNTNTGERSIYNLPISVAPFGLISSSTGSIPALQLRIGLKQNYDPYSISISYSYNSLDGVLNNIVSFNYPFAISGITRVRPSTVTQFYRLPVDLTTNSISSGSRGQEKMSIGALALGGAGQDGYFSYDDLSDFYYANYIDQNQNVQYKDGSVPSMPLIQDDPDGETTLDVQFASGVNPGITLDVLHIGGSTNTPFEDLLHLALQDTNVHVLSISYGIDESHQSIDVRGINTLFQSLGATGVSVLVASGDTGAYLVSSSGSSNSSSLCTRFTNSFPASSPYVTSVGGTTLRRTTTGTCPTEVVATIEYGSVITSGGGFSSLSQHPIPSWQQAAVSQWSSNNACPKPPASWYNASLRAYPDVSLLAHNYEIYFNSRKSGGHSSQSVDGTSASAPALAGMISAYNVARMSIGLKPLGFLNTLLYSIASSNPQAFNDITTGSIRCLSGSSGCCVEGYTACTGFDPASGLGSPNFSILHSYLIANGTSTLPVNTTARPNNFFPDCPNYVAFVARDWPPASSSSGISKDGAIALVSLAVVAFVAAFIYFGMRTYHNRIYGSLPRIQIRSSAPAIALSSPMPSQPSASPPAQAYDWRASQGHRLGSGSNDLQRPLARDARSEV